VICSGWESPVHPVFCSSFRPFRTSFAKRVGSFARSCTNSGRGTKFNFKVAMPSELASASVAGATTGPRSWLWPGWLTHLKRRLRFARRRLGNVPPVDARKGTPRERLIRAMQSGGIVNPKTSKSARDPVPAPIAAARPAHTAEFRYCSDFVKAPAGASLRREETRR
jgi:hypothetical protein